LIPSHFFGRLLGLPAPMPSFSASRPFRSGRSGPGTRLPILAACLAVVVGVTSCSPAPTPQPEGPPAVAAPTAQPAQPSATLEQAPAAISPTALPAAPTEEPEGDGSGTPEVAGPSAASQPSDLPVSDGAATAEADAGPPATLSEPPPAPADVATDPLAGALSAQEGDTGAGVVDVGASAGQTTRLLREGVEQFSRGDASSITMLPGEGAILELLPGGHSTAGEYLSAVHESAFAFDDAVLSWGADAPAGTSLRFELRARLEGGWSGWYAMGEWGPSGGRSISGQRDSQARVDIDILKLSAPATALQYRVLMTTTDPQATPLLRHVSVVYSDIGGGVTGPSLDRSPGSARDLPVPQHSQLQQDRSVASLICSPTSLAMVMQYWGAEISVMETVRGVRDRTTGIYGNWALNTAFAESLGFDARVDRFYSIEQMEREIEAGRPVVISVAFNPGELDGAPIRSTNGHLFVVRGFTESGDAIVNDPIAPTNQGVRLVYERDQLEKIWLRSGGIVYLLSPR
jgi:hypothetical protein